MQAPSSSAGLPPSGNVNIATAVQRIYINVCNGSKADLRLSRRSAIPEMIQSVDERVHLSRSWEELCLWHPDDKFAEHRSIERPI
jgi:hypothetical protein